jgi:hypothetical protein
MSNFSTAQTALYEEIERQVKAIQPGNALPGKQAALLRDLSLAFRHTVGGPQPGSVTASE